MLTREAIEARLDALFDQNPGTRAYLNAVDYATLQGAGGPYNPRFEPTTLLTNLKLGFMGSLQSQKNPARLSPIFVSRSIPPGNVFLQQENEAPLPGGLPNGAPAPKPLYTLFPS
jgi:hypothetical protein